MNNKKPLSFKQSAKVLGERLRRWREERNSSLRKVADRLHVTSATVSCWESGKRFPTGKHLDELVKMTGIAPCQFFCVHPSLCTACELSSQSRSKE